MGLKQEWTCGKTSLRVECGASGDISEKAAMKVRDDHIRDSEEEGDKVTSSVSMSVEARLCFWLAVCLWHVT